VPIAIVVQACGLLPHNHPLLLTTFEIPIQNRTRQKHASFHHYRLGTTVCGMSGCLTWLGSAIAILLQPEQKGDKRSSIHPIITQIHYAIPSSFFSLLVRIVQYPIAVSNRRVGHCIRASAVPHVTHNLNHPNGSMES
jgi:hypothetical protein